MPGVAFARKRWAPGPNARVDWSHPLSQRLSVLAVANGSRWVSLATGAVTQFAGPGKATPYGLGYDHSGNTTSNPGISGQSTATSPVTFFAAGLYTGSGASAFKGILSLRGAGTLHGLATGADTSVVGLWYGTSQVILGPTFSSPTAFTVVGSASSATSRLNVNGAVQTAAGQAATALTGTIELGGDNFAATPRQFPGTLNIVGMAFRQWSSVEEAMFTEDPFCMLRGA